MLYVSKISVLISTLYMGCKMRYPIAILGIVILLAAPAVCPGQWPEECMYENEPDLVDGYVDTWNGTCEDAIMEYTDDTICAESGWYFTDGIMHRDSDWFAFQAIPNQFSLTFQLERSLTVTMYSGESCGALNNIFGDNIMIAGVPETITFFSNSPQVLIIWFHIRPADMGEQSDTFRYTLSGSGFSSVHISDSGMTWGSMKTLYR
jgi:hypothetical protein